MMLFQHFEQARRIPRVRTIVKGQRDFGPGRVTVEQDIGVTALCKIIEAMEHFSMIIALHGKWQIKSPLEFNRWAWDDPGQDRCLDQ